MLFVDLKCAPDTAFRHARFFRSVIRPFTERNEPCGAILHAQRVKPHHAASGNNRREQRGRLIRHQEKDGRLRRLFKRLEQAVLRGGIHLLRVRNENHLRAVLKALDGNRFEHIAHHIDRDPLLALCRQHRMHIRMRSGKDAPTRAARTAGLMRTAAKRSHGAKLRGGTFARALRSCKEIGVDIAPPRKIALQPCDMRRLPLQV